MTKADAVSHEHLYRAMDETWPAAEFFHAERFTCRRGLGGGLRVSAISLSHNWQPEDITHASKVAHDWGQNAIYSVRSGQEDLDKDLKERGFDSSFETLILSAPAAQLTTRTEKDDVDSCSEIMLQIQRDIWQAGGHVNAARWQVMNRVMASKSYLLGRLDNRPRATGFVAKSGPVAMLHALEVHKDARLRGLGARLTAKAAAWAATMGADQLALLVTTENKPALAMYQGLGMEVVGKYHYRVQQHKELSHAK